MEISFCKAWISSSTALRPSSGKWHYGGKKNSSLLYIPFNIVVILFWNQEYLVAGTSERQKQGHGTQKDIPGKTVRISL